MDIRCSSCGEPWDVDHVLHEAEPGEFDRQGGLIRRCPCCKENRRTPLSAKERARLAAIAEVAPLFGDDLDGLAAFLEDMEVLDLH